MPIKLQNDRAFVVSYGRDRFDTHWKNKKIFWSDFVERLSTTQRTHETFAQYLKHSKDRRDEIKDVGGYVGGHITGGHRKHSSVIFRSIITLDIDFANNDVWDLFKMQYGCAACIYSTHSHSPEKPRYRLIVPLSREVEPEEYEPIARRIAGNIDIELFDNTGFQVERLMYWPSTSKDAEYIFHYQDGDFLDADEALSTYHDWKDVNEWPISERIDKLIVKGMKKQGDPLEKPGIVGAFCRTYSIETAIEKFLIEFYEKSDIEDRYSYVHGTTSNGVIVYDEKFSYSHHGTDPASGLLCNAFDLVRIHLFIEQDEEIEAKTPINKRPSFIAMREFAMKDNSVKRQVGTEKMERAKEDFEAAGIEDYDTDWLEKLEMDGKGVIKATIDNIVTILENDPILKDSLAFDSFRNIKHTVKAFTWKKDVNEPLTDNDIANIRHHIEKTYGISSVGKTDDAIEVVLKRHSYHPVREYFAGLPEWDGEFRLDRVLIDYLGAEDNEYVRAVTRKTFVAAVARIMRPGIKYDYMLVLCGNQGLKKSMLIDIMGGEFFSDSFNTVQGKEAYEQLQGHWLIEVSELAALRKSDVEMTKHFIAKRKDSYRPAYGKHTVHAKRQCIFIGTSNKEEFLIDETGNRRFWPVICTVKGNLKQLAEMRDQLWAEALTLHKAGEKLYLTDQLEAVAAEVQESHTEQDYILPQLKAYLDMRVPGNWNEMNLWERREFIQGDPLQVKGVTARNRITVSEIATELLGASLKDDRAKLGRALTPLLTTLKWRKTMQRINSIPTKCYVRPGAILSTEGAFRKN